LADFRLSGSPKQTNFEGNHASGIIISEGRKEARRGFFVVAGSKKGKSRENSSGRDIPGGNSGCGPKRPLMWEIENR